MQRYNYSIYRSVSFLLILKLQIICLQLLFRKKLPNCYLVQFLDKDGTTIAQYFAEESQ